MKKILFLSCVSSLILLSCFNPKDIKSRPMGKTSMSMNVAETSPFYNFKLKSLEGNLISFDQFKGKKIIILNVASKCGYTSQYADWEKFYTTHQQKIVVLGFPANNFMRQEPGTNDDIKAFCTKNYGVTFPMFEKISVKGDDKAPLYQWLTDKKLNGWNEQEPSWNFCKYLINENGELTNFFASDIKPDAKEFLEAIAK